MHERTQRAMARLMFVLCCALPTLLTASVIGFTWTPWYHDRCRAQIEAKLSDETGLIVQIDDFERATPSSLQLSGVRLLDPETKQPIASVNQVTWAQHFDTIAFVFRQPELKSAELHHVWQLIHDRFLCRPDQTKMQVSIVANDLTIHSHAGPLTLVDINALVTPQARVTLASLVGVLADSRESAPIKIHLTRDRRQETPVTSWRLDTGNTPLPCSALAECFPVMQLLGDDAMYAGAMTYSEQPQGGATLDLSASRFTQVELSRVFEKLPHKLTGTAELQLNRCLIGSDNKAIDVSGIVHATDGLIGGSMLDSLKQHLHFVMPVIDSSEPIRELEYDHVAFGFNIHNEVMKLTGVCGNERAMEYLPPGTIVCAGGQPLVYTSDEELEVIQLVNAISPRHGVFVLESEQTSGLAKFLKAPSRPRNYEISPAPPRVLNIATPSDGPVIRQGDTIRR